MTQRSNVWCNYQWHSTGARAPKPVKETESQLLLKFLQCQPEHVTWLWEQLQVDVDFQELAQWLANGDAIAASDRSYKDDLGTSSWRILSKHDQTTIIAGANFVLGRAHDQ
jgi:hypothetical protein